MKQKNKNVGKYLGIIFLIILGLLPVLWLIGKPGILIDGSDTNFPLNPAVWFQRRFFVWQNVSSLGSDFSSSTAGTFFHLLQFIPYRIGFSLQMVEILNLVFWFSLILFSSWFLARLILPKKTLPQIIFVILYSFNLYLFNSWENIKVANLSLVSAIPMGLSILILLRNGKISRPIAALLSLITGVILSGAGINPAYIICFFTILFAFLLAEMVSDLGNFKNSMERSKDFLIVFIFISLINSFWIIPTLHFIFANITPGNSIGQLGFTNWVDSLSENTSVLNVLRMQGAWDWYSVDSVTKLPVYIPYVAKYFYNPLFLVFSFLVPSLAFVAFILRRLVKNDGERFLYIFFGLILILGLFLAAGNHPPTGGLFRIFARHIPFFSLFRSPWYIFGQLVGLSVAGLVGFFFYTLDKFVSKKGIILSVEVLFVVFGLVYSYPLVLGRIYRPNFEGSFYIKFPPYVYSTRDWLEGSSARGRILSYPDDDIERYKWGYGAVDSIIGLISNREIVFSSISNTQVSLSNVVAELYSAIKKDEIGKAESIASTLGIGQIFDKRDEISLTSELPSDISKNKIVTLGEWSFYKFPYAKEPLPKIYPSSCCVLSYPYEDSAKNISLLSKNQVLVNPLDSLLNHDSSLQEGGLIIHGKNSLLTGFLKGTGDRRTDVKDLSRVDYTFVVPKSGLFEPVLEKRLLSDFGLATSKIKVNLDGRDLTLNIQSSDDSYVYFEKINLLSGQHTITIGLTNQNILDTKNFTRYGDGEFELNSNHVSIFNTSKQNSGLVYPVKSFDPESYYLFGVDYLHIYGNTAQVVISQMSNSTYLKNDYNDLPNYPEWRSVGFYYSPVNTKSSLSMKLVAPSIEDVLGTKILYKNMTAYRVFTNDLFLRQITDKDNVLPIVSFKENSPVYYSGEAKEVKGAHVIVFNENYSNDWELRTNSSNATIFHFTANSYANGWLIDGVNGDYTFTITYKPQRYLKWGYALSAISVFGVIGYLVLNKIRSKK